ncbi:hypothetical protein B0J14DRAFT_516566 [Halenospora varia]|nr:hypothetical protein B0J14DRAFT_516566 [Halenospora varia]
MSSGEVKRWICAPSTHVFRIPFPLSESSNENEQKPRLPPELRHSTQKSSTCISSPVSILSPETLLRPALLNFGVKRLGTEQLAMTRRTHRKSRGGCTNCKQRRVKCDEEKPSCGNCVTRDDKCTYKPSITLIWVKEGSNSSSPSIETSLESISIAQATTPSIEGLELIIHWFTTTVFTVNPVGDPGALHTSQTFILDQARHHPFLLHGLLALSALHLADSCSKTDTGSCAKYTSIATAHHNQGLAMYHSILQNMNEENYSASIAFSSLTIMFAFGLSRPSEIKLIDYLVQVFQLAKGWTKVVTVASDLSCNSARNLTVPAIDDLNTSLPSEIEEAFARLHSQNLTHTPDDHDQEVLKLALDSLKTVFKMLASPGGTQNPHVAIAWPNLLPERFAELLGKRQVLAMVLVAYYCVVLERVPKVWWLRGWSTGLLDAVWGNIKDGCLREEVQWVRDRVGVGTGFFINARWGIDAETVP